MKLLPPETVDRICKKLAKPDLANLRLVNKGISQIAVTHLFRFFRLFPTRDSLSTLENVSRGRLSKHVRSIIFDSSLLPELGSYKVWEGTIETDLALYFKAGVTDDDELPCMGSDEESSLRMREEKTRNLTIKGAKKYYEQYQQHLRSQNFFIYCSKLEGEIEGILRALPALTELEFDADIYSIYEIDERPPFKVEIETLITPNTWGWDAFHAMMLKVLFNAVGKAGKTIKSFKGCGIPEAWFQDPDKVGQDVAHFNAHVWTNLRHLELHLTPSRGGWSAIAELGEYLAMTHLLSLKFKGTTMHSHNHDIQMPLQVMLAPGHDFSCLKSLELSSLEDSEEQLITFFTSLKATLQALTLRDIKLISGNWVSVFKALHRNLNLTKVHLEGSLGQSHHSWSAEDVGNWCHRGYLIHRIAQFIMHRGECPFYESSESIEEGWYAVSDPSFYYWRNPLRSKWNDGTRTWRRRNDDEIYDPQTRKWYKKDCRGGETIWEEPSSG